MTVLNTAKIHVGRIMALRKEIANVTFTAVGTCGFAGNGVAKESKQNMAISSTVMAYPSHLHHRLHPRCTPPR